MNRKLFINIPEIVQNGGLVPNSFEEAISHIHRPGGFWLIQQINKFTNDVVVEQWCANNWSDNGISQMYDAVVRASAPTQFTPANIMVISQTLGFTTLAANISSGGTVTSIQVGALTGPTIPSGTTLVIDPGAGHANFVVTLAANITGAGTYAVSSTPGPGSLINSGVNIRYAYTAVPTADPSTIAAPVSYTAAMASGQFTKTITTGYGNRQIQVTNDSAYLFSTTGSPPASAASYSEGWLSNTNPISATNQTVIRVAFDSLLVIDSTHNGKFTCIEKL